MSNIQNYRDRSPRSVTLAGVFAIGGASLMIGFLAITDTQVAMNASLRGVAVWWDVLFPALFPFFVLSEMLLGFGIVHLAGTLLDPFMRPLFRLPGVGGFIVAIGFASGYPVGARLTSRLMEQKLVNRNQGERLVAMTTTSDPIFLIGAVCIGFFGSLQAAPVLAIAHYCGALLLGLGSRFGRRDPDDSAEIAVQHKTSRLRAALAAMHKARMDDGRPFGILLQQSLQSSLTLMMIVGGLVVFFSATLDLLVHSGFLSLFRDMIGRLLHVFGMSSHLSHAFVNGTFEVTLGAKASAADTEIPLVDRVAAAAFVLSWAGLSVHAQVAGLMSRTAWRYLPFARARLIHGLLAMAFVYILWPVFFPKNAVQPSSVDAWLSGSPPSPWSHAGFSITGSFFPLAAWLPFTFILTLSLIVIAGTVAIGIRKLRTAKD